MKEGEKERQWSKKESKERMIKRTSRERERIKENTKREPEKLEEKKERKKERVREITISFFAVKVKAETGRYFSHRWKAARWKKSPTVRAQTIRLQFISFDGQSECARSVGMTYSNPRSWLDHLWWLFVSIFFAPSTTTSTSEDFWPKMTTSSFCGKKRRLSMWIFHEKDIEKVCVCWKELSFSKVNLTRNKKEFNWKLKIVSRLRQCFEMRQNVST